MALRVPRKGALASSQARGGRRQGTTGAAPSSQPEAVDEHPVRCSPQGLRQDDQRDGPVTVPKDSRHRPGPPCSKGL